MTTISVVIAEWTKLSQALAKGSKKEDGPSVRALDLALAVLSIRRQAYYSGTFVGNLVLRAQMVQ